MVCIVRVALLRAIQQTAHKGGICRFNPSWLEHTNHNTSAIKQGLSGVELFYCADSKLSACS